MKERIQFDFNVDIKEAIKEFNYRSKLISEAIKDVSFPNSNINGDTFDKRDLSEIINFMPIVGKDDNEKKQFIRNNYKDMVNAFVSNDKDDIKVYLEMLYSNYDKLGDYYKKGINTIDEFVNFQFLFSADQTMQTKRLEHTDIFYKHYDTKEKLNKYATNSYLTSIMMTDISKLKQENPGFDNKNDVPYALIKDAYKFDREFGDAVFDSLENKSNIVEIRDTSSFLQSKNTKVERINEEFQFNQAIYSSNFLNDITSKELNAGDININSYKLAFLDGKSIYDLAKEEIDKNYKNKIKDSKENLINKQCVKMLQTALAMGDKAITYAIPKHLNGKIEFSLMKLKPNVKPQETQERAKHSAFRLKFFNWGPFRIKPCQDVANELANSKKYDKSILEKASKTFNDFVKKGQENNLNVDNNKNPELINDAKKYLLKENYIDLQKDTNLEKSSKVEPMKENPKEKEINIEIDTKSTNLE